jgi:hypothetical protein
LRGTPTRALTSKNKPAPVNPTYRRKSNLNSHDTSRDVGSSSGPRALYPASIAFLIEERPLLWYEDPEEYQQLREMSLSAQSHLSSPGSAKSPRA